MAAFYQKINKNAEKVAQAVVNALPIATVLELVKWIQYHIDCQIDVRYINLEDKKCSGFLYFESQSRHCRIFIDNSESPTRQRFTLCHELAHIIANVGIVYGFLLKEENLSHDEEERFCDRFSAAFLMPQRLFLRAWNANRGDELSKLIELSFQFRVSIGTVRYRAIELGLLSN